jgi:carbon starvation protein CstA
VTPANELEDGVDFVPLKAGKIFLIQLLNIAGLGPIFGAIMGAMFGPVAFLWIVLGSIFAGATHDYLSGMMSVRHKGQSVTEIVGIYLGSFARTVMVIFAVVLLVFVGTVFMVGPAKLLANLGMEGMFATQSFWLTVIILYYFIATIVPVDKVIGKVYPVFGAALLFMALGIGGSLIWTGAPIPEIGTEVLHPKGLSVWPLLFITIACGAISGFHATQSPLMARCITTEKYGRGVFYGAMIAEGLIALVWAAAAMSLFPNGVAGLGDVLAKGGPALVVNEIAVGQLGVVGGLLAVLGVIIAPISSGDTAFRSARLTIADALKLTQGPRLNRLYVAVPIFAIGIGLTFVDFSIIWRYFAWSNQTLATIVLWTGAAYLATHQRFHWIATIPATFMTAVVTTYILIAKEGLMISSDIATPAGIAVAVIVLAAFLYKIGREDGVTIEEGY